MGANPPTKLVSLVLSADAELRELVELFVDGLPTRLAELQEAYEALDWGRLVMLAHRLKGASGSYGYPDLTSLGAAMENAFAAQRAEYFSQWIDQLKALIAAARAGLQQP